MRILFYILMILGVPGQTYSGSDLPEKHLKYHVDLNQRDQDLFNVELSVQGLERANAVFQFAATAPGTYQIMDIGRYVRSFQCFDESGKVIETRRLSTNQWLISEPQRARLIRYQIAETWDTPVSQNEIYPMAGTSLEADHVVINGHAVFGFPKGYQDVPIQLQLTYPKDWTIGTALPKEEEGSYYAEDFDHIVDSPILLGRKLSQTSRQVGNCLVSIYAYSKSGRANAREIMTRLDDIIDATHAYLDGFPVSNYTFLYHFEDFSAGAWEHNYSSFYVASDPNYERLLDDFIPRTAAHEIFHMVTPLHIHSEKISPFNFVTPNPSQHVWFYEGVTEWASGMIQLRGGLQDLPLYLSKLTKKLNYNDDSDSQFSLRDISLLSYSPKGQREWGNIYNRGSLTATLMDIQLLKRTHGKRGLREVIKDLSQEYGKDRAFPEAGFYQVFISKTYPEMEPFINNHIKDTKPLPIKDTFAHLGIEYIAAQAGEKMIADVDVELKVTSSRKVVFTSIKGHLANLDLKVDDELLTINDMPVNGDTIYDVKALLANYPPGKTMILQIKRENKERTLTTLPVQKREIIRHTFKILPGTPKQQALRKAWMTNPQPSN